MSGNEGNPFEFEELTPKERRFEPVRSKFPRELSELAWDLDTNLRLGEQAQDELGVKVWLQHTTFYEAFMAGRWDVRHHHGRNGYLSPGPDVSQFEVVLQGAEGLRITQVYRSNVPGGDLQLYTPVGRVPVESCFREVVVTVDDELPVLGVQEFYVGRNGKVYQGGPTEAEDDDEWFEIDITDDIETLRSGSEAVEEFRCAYLPGAV